MITFDRRLWSSKIRTQPLGFAVLYFLILFLRRRAQLLNPQIWAEDGSQILRGFLDHGWASLAFPANGYLITTSKLLIGGALTLSAAYLPAIATIADWIFTVLVCLAITYCPTWLRARWCIALATLLVPSDPEVFGIPLYSFWWASLLLFLVVLWDDESADLKWRISMVLLGGLSSPIIFLVTPFLFIRLILLKQKKIEGLVLAVSVACCAVQAAMVHNSIGNGSITASKLLLFVPKFLGSYVSGNLRNPTLPWLWVTGLLVCVFVISTMFCGAAARLRNWFILGLWVGAMLMSAVRMDLALIHPHLAGPRYFFFPFVLLSWLIISALPDCRVTSVKVFGVVLLSAAFVNALPVLSRDHVDLHWTGHVVSCSHFSEYALPIGFNGQGSWYLFLTHPQAVKLQQWGVLNVSSPLVRKKTFPYRVIPLEAGQSGAWSSDHRIVSASSIVEDTWRGQDYGPSRLPGLRVVGSLPLGGSDQGRLSIHMHRGARILFREGAPSRQSISIESNGSHFLDYVPATPDWVELEFSNDQLPPEFTVTFTDAGSGVTEWSAVAVRP